MISYQNIYRRTTLQILFHCINIIRPNHHRTYKENDHIIHDWRFSIIRLVHENMDAKTGILLQLLPHVYLITTVWTKRLRVSSL